MAKSKDPKHPKKQPSGDYPVGYARPPVAGQIQPGEVRNKHGRNGAPKAAEKDAFEEAMNRLVPLTIDGETVMVTAEQAIWLKHTAAALGGDSRPFRIIVQELRSRRSNSPPGPTRDEIEDKEKKKAIVAKLVAGLEEMAKMKKLQGAPGFFDEAGDTIVS